MHCYCVPRTNTVVNRENWGDWIENVRALWCMNIERLNKGTFFFIYSFFVPFLFSVRDWNFASIFFLPRSFILFLCICVLLLAVIVVVMFFFPICFFVSFHFSASREPYTRKSMRKAHLEFESRIHASAVDDWIERIQSTTFNRTLIYRWVAKKKNDFRRCRWFFLLSGKMRKISQIKWNMKCWRVYGVTDMILQEKVIFILSHSILCIWKHWDAAI